MILSKKGKTKALVSLLGCAGWSAPVLFANPEDRFSRVAAHIIYLIWTGRLYCYLQLNTLTIFLQMDYPIQNDTLIIDQVSTSWSIRNRKYFTNEFKCYYSKCIHQFNIILHQNTQNFPLIKCDRYLFMQKTLAWSPN